MSCFLGCFLQKELGLLYSYMADECKCLSEPPSATCSSFPASISQSACNVHAGQCPSHTAKQVKWFIEAKNIEIMKLLAQSPDLKSPDLSHFGDKVMAKKPTTVTELWKRVEEEWTKITTAQF